MNPVLASIYMTMALVIEGNLNATTLSRLNMSSLSACIGDTVKLPSFPQDKCSGRSLLLVSPNRTRLSKTTGRFIKKKNTFEISNIKESDKGLWFFGRYCDRTMETLIVNLQVNCKYLSARAEHPLSMKCPKPSIPENATKVTMEIFYKLTGSPNTKPMRLVKDGKITEEGKRRFGKRVTVESDGHTLNIDSITKADGGNYTCLWRWVNNVFHRGSRKFVFRINVTVPKESPTTTPAGSRSTTDSAPQPTNNTDTSTAPGKATYLPNSLGTNVKANVLAFLLLFLLKLV